MDLVIVLKDYDKDINRSKIRYFIIERYFQIKISLNMCYPYRVIQE